MNRLLREIVKVNFWKWVSAKFRKQEVKKKKGIKRLENSIWFHVMQIVRKKGMKE